MVDMTTSFVETDHPRGQAGNAGQFRDKLNDAPSGALTEGATADVRSCIRCAEETDSAGDVFCAECKRDDAVCQDCGSPVGEGDCPPCQEIAADNAAAARREAYIRWGEAGVHVGSRTPWGTADHTTDVAPGITIADTSSHGGVKLSPERNKVIPPALRASSGWYEEDCEYNIPARYFAEEFAAQPHITRTADEFREDADSSIKHWFPTQWEKANGRELAPGESRTKDESSWAAAQGDKPIVTSASRSKSDPDMLVVTARPLGHDGTGAPAEYLVPAAEYETRRASSELGQNHRFVVDPARHPQLPPAPAAPSTEKPVHRAPMPDVHELMADSTLTTTARDRILGDLNKRWSMRDGRVLSLRDMIEEEGVHGVHAWVEGTRMNYSVSLQGGYSTPVKKATWDYLQRTLPDTRTEAQRASADYSVAANRLFEETGGGSWRHWRDPKAKARAEKLEAEVNRLHAVSEDARAREAAERATREGTPEERAAAADRAQAERERAARVQGAGA